MKLSTLQRFLKFHPNSDDILNRHYVRLSHDKDVNAEPLFWLQYAILMKSSGDIGNARLFLNAGYERASRIEGFRTFQLDTQALSIYLLEEIGRQDKTVEGLEDILRSIKTVTDMIADPSNRQHAIEVIGEIPAFIEARRTALKEPEKVALIFDLHRAMRALSDLPTEEQAYTGSELIRSKLQTAVSTLAM